MRVIDAMSGQELRLGQQVDRPGGGYVKLLDVDPGLFSAEAFIETSGPERIPIRRQVPLQVRWTHPSYFLEHVAFIPS